MGDRENTSYWLDVLLQGSQDGASAPEDENFEIDEPAASMPNMLPTISTNPKRPRTVKAGFDYTTFKMIVVFRDGTWWQYNGVPVQIWEGFKAAASKGKYLTSSGLDSWPDMGPADMAALSKAQRTLINDMKGYLDNIYKG